MQISLILPCYNEEANIEAVVREAFAWFAKQGIDGEVIVTNDGSVDQSQKILERLQGEFSALQVVRHEANRGYGAALSSGCDRATKEYIAFMDSDRQFHVDDLGLLLPHLSTYRFVTGVRQKRADPWRRLLNAALYNWLLRHYVGLNVRDINCALKIFERNLWQRLRPTHATGALFNAEVYLALLEGQIPWKEVPVPHYPRTAGTQTGAKLSVILRMFRELAYLKKRQKMLAGNRLHSTM